MQFSFLYSLGEHSLFESMRYLGNIGLLIILIVFFYLLDLLLLNLLLRFFFFLRLFRWLLLRRLLILRGSNGLFRVFRVLSWFSLVLRHRRNGRFLIIWCFWWCNFFSIVLLAILYWSIDKLTRLWIPKNTHPLPHSSLVYYSALRWIMVMV